ncbi:MAG: hypothetical protein CVV42_07720 [Candidatus Riflebacteria bacterium HGW-Riflebacteria-2]|jgi:hypothetical protein|nr:MAG: hypothetical protein CVV42_07720 [Candidatus Riflebacteria bacterium HGW-Riflebacteria-2]
MIEKETIDLGREFVRASFSGRQILLTGITGSHYYGFPAPDSDLDLKGIHADSLREAVGLSRPQPAINIEKDWRGCLCDFSSNEIEQALRLLLKGNGNMLERIFSPLQLFETAELKQLQELKSNYLSQRFYHHYNGFFQKKCEEYTKAGSFPIKPMLYIYRVALTGIHLLLTGEVVGDVRVTAAEHGFAEISELVEIYATTSEKSNLNEGTSGRFVARWPLLQEKLDQALKKSPLPELPPGEDLCSE